MKKFFKFPVLASIGIALTALLFSLSFSSCGNDDDDDLMIWDISPVILTINIQDSEGNNLLFPTVEGNWFDHPMTMEYDNKTYKAQWNWPFFPEEQSTRAYLPVFYGLHINPLNPKNPTLEFGEFDGAKNQEIDATFRVEGYEQAFHIVYKHTIKWKNNIPSVTNKITLNGEPVNRIVITLPKNTSAE